LEKTLKSGLELEKKEGVTHPSKESQGKPWVCSLMAKEKGEVTKETSIYAAARTQRNQEGLWSKRRSGLDKTLLISFWGRKKDLKNNIGKI